MPRIPVLAALCAALLLPAATAHAGEEFTIGEGDSPHLIVDAADGTAHVVWADETADTIHTCEVPRAATACTDEETLGAPGGSPDAPFLVRRDATRIDLLIPHYVLSEVWRYTSFDNGATWGALHKIYDKLTGTDATEPILNAAGDEFVIPSWNPSRYIVTPLANGSESAGTAEIVLDGGGVSSLVYDLMVGRSGPNYVAVANNLDNAYVWTSANLVDWSAPTLIGEGDDTRVASDGTNAYMFANGGPSGTSRVEIRRWTGSAFGPPVVINERPYINDIVVSPSSAVGAIWRRNDSPNRLRFALSTDGGASFAVRTIGLSEGVMPGMDVGLASDNQGFVVYEGPSVPSTGARRFIRMRNTDAVAEPPPAGSGGGGGPTPTPTPAPGPTPTPLPRPSTTPLAVGRRVTTTSNGATISLGLPRGCIPAGRPFIATLTWRKQRRKGNKFVKITRTDFYIGTRRLKIDRRAPFRQTLRIPNPRRGQTYRFRARAFIKVRRGRSPKKSIVSTLRVCS